MTIEDNSESQLMTQSIMRSHWEPCGTPYVPRESLTLRTTPISSSVFSRRGALTTTVFPLCRFPLGRACEKGMGCAPSAEDALATVDAVGATGRCTPTGIVVPRAEKGAGCALSTEAALARADAVGATRGCTFAAIVAPCARLLGEASDAENDGTQLKGAALAFGDVGTAFGFTSTEIVLLYSCLGREEENGKDGAPSAVAARSSGCARGLPVWRKRRFRRLKSASSSSGVRPA
jgi:hypothetical protein